MLMEFRDGQDLLRREYLDTQHAYDVWITPAHQKTMKATYLPPEEERMAANRNDSLERVARKLCERSAT